MNIEKIARVIEADAGEALPDLCQALGEAKARLGHVTTPEQILVFQAREAASMTQQAFARHINKPSATLRDWE